MQFINLLQFHYNVLLYLSQLFCIGLNIFLLHVKNSLFMIIKCVEVCTVFTVLMA